MSAFSVPIYLAFAFLLCWLGKLSYGFFHPKTKVDRELLARENLAFAVPLGAYYFGILLVMGGPLSGQAHGGLLSDLFKTGCWGLLGIVMLNAAAWADRRILFKGIDLDKEILAGENLSAGIAAAGSYLANSLIVLGALSGDGGVLSSAVLWLYAQVMLSAAAAATDRWMDIDLPFEVHRGNKAAALAYAGNLVAMGNVMRMSLAGSFPGWLPALATVTAYGIGGMAVLALSREFLHRLLLRGVTVRHEILEHPAPNAGVGYLVALFALGASFLIGWCL